MSRLVKRIELIANVCIIVTALVICGLVVKRFLVKSRSNISQISGVSVGTKIGLPGIDWSKNGKTLVLVLSVGCKFCSASAPFYQNLAKQTASPKGAKLVAILPQGVDQAGEYLRSLNIHVDDVKQATLTSLGVRATPTLILANNEGIVTNSWVGQLPSDKEMEVVAQLR
jgi:hypothetical protein